MLAESAVGNKGRGEGYECAEEEAAVERVGEHTDLAKKGRGPS